MEKKEVSIIEKKRIKKNRCASIFVAIIILAIFLFFTIKSVQYTYKIQITQLGNQSHSQMMGYVIKTYHNKVIVIDGGTFEDTQNLINTIEHMSGKVDAWFITHPHKDHASCIIDIIKNKQIPIEHIYVSLNDMEWYEKYEPNRVQEVKKLKETLEDETIKNKVIEPKLNETINIDNITCEILGTKNPEITTNAINNSSMIVRISTNNKNILFLGDIGAEGSSKLINSQPQEKLKADVVQMAHHGQAGASEDLYKIIKPKICMWPTPEWLWTNDSGNGEDTGTWKIKETRKWMKELNVKENIIEKDGNRTIII